MEKEVHKGKCPTCGLEVTYEGRPPEVCPHCKVGLRRKVRLPTARGSSMTTIDHHVFFGHGKWI